MSFSKGVLLAEIFEIQILEFFNRIPPDAATHGPPLTLHPCWLGALHLIAATKIAGLLPILSQTSYS